MGHFALSMLILVAAVMLVWRADARAAGAVRAPPDRTLVWSVRGTARARRADDLRRHRRDRSRAPRRRLAGAEDQPPDFDGRGTMDFVIHRHARDRASSSGSRAVAVWWLARRAGRLRRAAQRAADVAVRADRAAGRRRPRSSMRRTCRPSSSGCTSGSPARVARDPVGGLRRGPRGVGGARAERRWRRGRGSRSDGSRIPNSRGSIRMPIRRSAGWISAQPRGETRAWALKPRKLGASIEPESQRLRSSSSSPAVSLPQQRHSRRECHDRTS